MNKIKTELAAFYFPQYHADPRNAAGTEKTDDALAGTGQPDLIGVHLEPHTEIRVFFPEAGNFQQLSAVQPRQSPGSRFLCRPHLSGAARRTRTKAILSDLSAGRSQGPRTAR